MTETSHINTKRVGLLFLGNIETDRRIKNFIRAFSEDGYDCEIIYATPGINSRSSHKLENCQATRLPLQRSSGPLMFYEYHLKLQKELRRQKSFDIILACELYSLTAGKNYVKRNNARLLYDARELYTGIPTVVHSPLKRRIWKCIEGRSLKKVDAIIVTAPLDAGAISEVHHFLPRSFLVRNLPYEYTAPKRTSYLRDTYPEIGSRQILIYVGGVQADRGLEEMIDVMPQLSKEAVYVIVGDGVKRAALFEKVKHLGLKQSVFLHPAVDSESVIGILTSADVGVSLIKQDSPSYKLALPSKVFEYIAAGLPVLTTPLEQVNQLFGEKEWLQYTDLTTESIVVASRNMLTKIKANLFATELANSASLHTFRLDIKPLLTHIRR